MDDRSGCEADDVRGCCCGGSCTGDDDVFGAPASKSVGFLVENCDRLSLGSRDVDLEGTGAFDGDVMTTGGAHLDERAREADLSVARDWLAGEFQSGRKGAARRSSTGLGIGKERDEIEPDLASGRMNGRPNGGRGVVDPPDDRIGSADAGVVGAVIVGTSCLRFTTSRIFLKLSITFGSPLSSSALLMWSGAFGVRCLLAGLDAESAECDFSRCFFFRR